MDLTALAVKSLVLYALAEHQAGYVRTVRIDASDRAFAVSDDGRGHAIDRSVDGTPYLSFIYEQLRYPFGRDMPGPVQLQGIGMSLVNALCSELEVVAQRSERALRLVYADGRLQSQERIEGDSSKTGNWIRGVVSSRLCSDALDEGELQGWLQGVQQSAPTLTLHFNGSSIRAGQPPGA